MSVEQEIRIQASEKEALDETIRRVISEPLPRSKTLVGQSTGALDDLPTEILDRIPAEVDRHRDHMFHEFAFQATGKKLSHDSTGALLMAVAAIEGAHSAFVQESHVSRGASGSRGDSKGGDGA